VKKNPLLFWLAAVWTFFGPVTKDFAQGLKVPGMGVVRTVHGKVEYAKGDQWLAVKPNLPIVTGTILRTGPNSYVSLFLKDTSAVRLESQTTMAIQELARSGTERGADTETILDLKSGTILGDFGNFNRLAVNTRYVIQTSNGLARILGGVNFKIESAPQPEGVSRVTFTSVGGDLFCFVSLDGQNVTKALHSGECWTPGDKGNEHLRPPGAAGSGGSKAPAAPLSAPELQSLQKIARDYNSFGFQLLKAAGKSFPNKNIFLSPLGAAVALSAAGSGARGATRQEITKALGLQALPPSGLDEAAQKMLDYLSTLVGNLTLEMADGLWFDRKTQIKPDFLANARNFYNSDAKNVDLQDPDAVVAVNDWVKERTHGAIAVAFQSLEPAAGMIVVDAFHIKARWASCFEKELTQEKTFHFAHGGSVTHPQMRKTDYFPYMKTNTFQLAALPYQASATMHVLLPNGSLEEMIHSLDAEHWEQWISSLARRKGMLELPRFELYASFELKSALEALGIHAAFQQAGADFTAMAGTPLWISQVEERTYLNVDEEGTEASAASDFFMESKEAVSARPEAPFQMVVDHPYLLVIRENVTGAILFMGAILDPRH
jgi:serpin B